LRAQAGADFASQPSAADIDGTRRNMLGEKGLNAAQYPFIEIWSERVRRSGDGLNADIVVSVRGTLSRISIPIDFIPTGSTSGASGKFTVRQSDLGMSPFSILMGAIAVRDELEIEYSITVESTSGIEDVLATE
jgi:polyisoprenoid-binding protein YceI